MKQVKYFKHDETLPNLEFKNGYGNSVAIDLYTAEEVTISPFEFKLISMGVSIDIPQGYKIDLRMRSSTFKKYGLIQTNSVGLIDSTYVGLGDIIKLPVYKLPKGEDMSSITIPKGTALCQIEIVPCMQEMELLSVTKEEYPSHETRGGFGSTDGKCAK